MYQHLAERQLPHGPHRSCLGIARPYALATLEWVDWFNHRRLFHELGRIPPAEFEDLHYRQHESRQSGETHTATPA